MKTANIIEMARGAILEQVEVEMGKILQNIVDPNTKPTGKRSLTIKIDFEPNQNRDNVSVKSTVKSSLQASSPVQTSLYVGDNAGSIMAIENTPQIPGQLSLDGAEQEPAKVLQFKAI